jgi:hypothetical protein
MTILIRNLCWPFAKSRSRFLFMPSGYPLKFADARGISGGIGGSRFWLGNFDLVVFQQKEPRESGDLAHSVDGIPCDLLRGSWNFSAQSSSHAQRWLAGDVLWRNAFLLD